MTTVRQYETSVSSRAGVRPVELVYDQWDGCATSRTGV